MPPALPLLAGVEHADHTLPTGVRVHVAALGPEAAPPVLALHGWPQHWWAWREVAPLLASDRRVLMPDLRGFGWSGFPGDGDFTKERLADDVLALLDALGLERVALLGHDWGAWTAMLAALRAPERFSCVLAMSIGLPWTPTSVAARNAWRLLYQLPLAAPLAGEALVRDGRYVRELLVRGRRDDAGWGPGEVEAYVDALRSPEAARASSLMYRHFLVREVPENLRGAFRGRRLRVPIRILHGSRDPLGRELAGGIERHADDGALEIVRGAGHYLPEEDPRLVADRARVLLDR
jgi:pimeloyl-ACP methyl ester carboxylesterase